MKYLLILNPGSKSGKGKKLWNTWLSLLQQRNAVFETVVPNSTDHIVDIAKQATEFDAIVAVGGDGTINRVVTGILDSSMPNRSIGVLYSGTSPDFCRFHKIPLSPVSAVDALLSNKNKLVDVAKITYQNIQKNTESAYFICSCNIGLGAEVARKANYLRKFFGDKCGTGLASIWSIINSSKIELKVKTNILKATLSQVNNLSVIINPYLASGLKLNISKTPTDGKLILFALQKRNCFSLLKDLEKFYTGTIINAQNVFLADCQKLEVTTSANQEVEFDGDPYGFLPLTIELQSKKLKLLGCDYA